MMWYDELMMCIERGDFEDDMVSHLDLFLERILKEDAQRAKGFLMNVFLVKFDDVSVIVGILRSLAHMEFNDIFPEGHIMALAALSHKDAEVRERGIRVLEQGTGDCLIALKSIRNDSEKWIQEYMEKVISDMENQEI